MSAQPGLFRKYVLDTSFFIDLFTPEGRYARDIHVGLWRHFEGQIGRAEIIAPMEVREELEDSIDEKLDRWLSAHRSMFVEITKPQLDVIQKIVCAYPAFTKGKKNMADPSVVALGAAENLIVLTSELRQQQRSPHEPKIPHLCEDHDVDYLGINEYMRAEGIVLNTS